ncbi:MAG TPA: hypothetical protein VFO77_07610, partial [Actinoplanes sp.]|nr:hypothetical protein [Actinoplanes sp.]
MDEQQPASERAEAAPQRGRATVPTAHRVDPATVRATTWPTGQAKLYRGRTSDSTDGESAEAAEDPAPETPPTEPASTETPSPAA